MSIDIDWETLTGGSDGAALAETVRDFIHDRFQNVTLPKFIRSVHVQSFDFGTVVPEVEVKDVCDPLPDFYEGEDESGSESEEEAEEQNEQFSLANRNGLGQHAGVSSQLDGGSSKAPVGAMRPLRPALNTTVPFAPNTHSPLDLHSYFPSRSSTPAIPGGTSNLNRHHYPFSAGISGAPTPLSAFTGAHFGGGWPDAHASFKSSDATGSAIEDPFRRGSDMPLSGAESPRDISPNDIQTVVRIKYSGDFKLSLTAEILLDYPMDSFVGIPLQLNISGMDFDGIAILAYIKRKLHFCFLSPEDADALVGGDVSPETPGTTENGDQGAAHSTHVGGLFENIKVESEIGQRNNSKQMLKNVGKVEKFVLEQVRRTFENELVYPSFWTFLV